MNGRYTFSTDEVVVIRRLLRDTARAGSADQKAPRAKLRRLGFYIEDFTLKRSPFRVADLDALVRDGTIKVVD